MKPGNISEKAHRPYHCVLTIAGSDSSGGAGIQADIKTFSALGCYGLSVITALTAQNTIGVRGIHPVPAAFIQRQMEAVFSDMVIDAVKIGMLCSVEQIETVAAQLKKHRAANIVLDPVMVAQSGERLQAEEAVEALKAHLMPLSDVVTPNLPEAAAMLKRPIHRLPHMKTAAVDLVRYGTGNIFLKGGHLQNNPGTDLLYLGPKERLIVLKENPIPTRNNHGTGCTLSSAISANLAKGMDVETAVRKAKIYISEAIRFGAPYKLGAGAGPVHHFFKFWK
jgi:hydroxymethylpyrimidine/phosphomethylpyrimidine kinase